LVCGDQSGAQIGQQLAQRFLLAMAEPDAALPPQLQKARQLVFPAQRPLIPARMDETLQLSAEALAQRANLLGQLVVRWERTSAFAK
jgi:hypothetical protein